MMKSWHSLASQMQWNTSVSSTTDRDVARPVILESMSSVGAASSLVTNSLPSTRVCSSSAEVTMSPCLLPRWEESTVSNDGGSLSTPPPSDSTIAVSSQDSSSHQLSSGEFLFGLSGSLSKPFKFDASNSSFSVTPFCVTCTSAEYNPPFISVDGSASRHNSTSDSVPVRNTNACSHDDTVAASTNIQLFGTLPMDSIKLTSDAAATVCSTLSTVNSFQETLPILHTRSPHITSNVGVTPLLEIPPNVANFQSFNVSNSPALHSGDNYSQTKPLTGLFHAVSTSQQGEFLSKSDVEYSKQLSLSSVFTWTPQSFTHATQARTSATPASTLPPHTHSQLMTNSFHEEAVSDDTASCDHESSPHFEPLISLPLIKALSSGEEDEQVLFSQRAKLYRFHNSQWKERGVGNMKILKHKISGKVRLLMRRDQTLKLCCNHYISCNMSITEMKGNSELAWCTNCDFSDGISKPEKFAIKFKHQETGIVFKQIFEECAVCNSTSDDTSGEFSAPGSGNQTCISVDKTGVLSQKEASSLDSLLVTNRTLSCDNSSVQNEVEYGSAKPIPEDSSSHVLSTDQPDGDLEEVILTKVEMPSNDKIELARQLMLPDTFFNYENKPSCPGCRGCVDGIDRKRSTSQDQEHKLAINYRSCNQSANLGIFGNTSKLPVTGFAELAVSESSTSPFLQLHPSLPLQAFQGAGEALFEKHVEEVDDLGADDTQFKAIVSLPEVDVKTGEENEQVLFTHRAKLFRFDSIIGQWKERGIGDIKLLKNVNTNKVRIIMRRDQIFKICCNHFITSDMSLLAFQDRSWMWFTLSDFADEVPRPEKFAVKFKSAEIAQMFKQIFENCVSRCKLNVSEINEEVIEKVAPDTSDINLKEQFAPKHGSWICSICSVCNPESVTLCLACQSPKPGQNKLLSPQTSAAILKELHICSPTKVAGNHNAGEFQLPLNITLPTCSAISIPVTKSMTTVSLSPRLISPDLHVLDSLASVSEKEEVIFSASGILYKIAEECEHQQGKQWDKGSHGEMKVIRNKSSGEKKLLMISKDYKSALCSHGITSMMHLKPHAEKERAWTWNGFDNSQSTPTESAVQKYCIEFHSNDDALRFKKSFGMSFSLPIDNRQPPYIAKNEVSDKNYDELLDEVALRDNQLETLSESDDVIFLYEETSSPSLIKKAEELLLPKSFYLYEKKSPCRGCRGCDNGLEHASYDHQITAEPAAFTEPDSLPNYKGEISATEGFSSTDMLSFTDLISEEDSSVSSFPKVGRFQFDGAGKQLFSTKLKGEEDPEAEADIDFSPLVTLPETYHVKSWDENAKTLFLQRAKLYRFDGSIKQWKERGIGDMKILQHPDTKKVCLIMRRDQILKLCCNHYLTEDMQLIQLETERSWMWFTPSDFSGDNPQPEQFAIRFKCAERGLEFKKVFDECVTQLKLTAKPVHTRPTTKDTALINPDVDYWECPQCLVRNKNKECKCAACGYTIPGGCLDSITVSLGSSGGVKISSLVSTSMPSNTEPYALNTRSVVGGIKIPLLQEVHLSTSTNVQTSLPSEGMTPTIAAASSHLHTAPMIFQPLAEKDHIDKNRSDTS